METSTMKNVFLYGAIDRFNYGDLLLPVILKEKLTAASNDTFFNVRVFGTIESDLSGFGALPTESLSSFYHALKTMPAFVLIVGGEALTPSWSTVYSHLQLPLNRWHEATLPFRRVNNMISKRILHGRGRRPFILETRSFPLIQGVLYNGVGGKRRGSYKRSDFFNLKNACYLSCRDDSVLHVLQKNLPQALLVPDSAIQMSELFSKVLLKERASDSKKILFETSYLFFQISNAVAVEIGVESIALKLRSFAEKFGLKVVLCPIGTASGHDDQIALKALKALLPEDSFILIEDPTLWEIMGLIAHATLYMGGSLHGIITSMSFEVPYLYLRNRPKLVSYVDTWGVDSLKELTTMQNWEERIETAFNLDRMSLKESRLKQLQISETSFQRMVEILQNS